MSHISIAPQISKSSCLHTLISDSVAANIKYTLSGCFTKAFPKESFTKEKKRKEKKLFTKESLKLETCFAAERVHQQVETMYLKSI